MLIVIVGSFGIGVLFGVTSLYHWAFGYKISEDKAITEDRWI